MKTNEFFMEAGEYVAPQVEVIEVVVERGFAGTEEDPGTIEGGGWG